MLCQSILCLCVTWNSLYSHYRLNFVLPSKRFRMKSDYLCLSPLNLVCTMICTICPLFKQIHIQFNSTRGKSSKHHSALLKFSWHLLRRIPTKFTRICTLAWMPSTKFVFYVTLELSSIVFRTAYVSKTIYKILPISWLKQPQAQNGHFGYVCIRELSAPLWLKPKQK